MTGPPPPWDPPQPLTAAAVEARLSEPAVALTMMIRGAARSGPGADARLLGLLARYRGAGAPVEVRAGYRLAALEPPTQGWEVALGSPTMHLLAAYAATLRDNDGQEVLPAVRSRQAERLARDGRAGVVTTTGGQTAIIDSAGVLLSKSSRTVFAETKPEQLRQRLDALAGRRGFGDALDAPIVAYLAEALENVREHAVDVDARGLCLLQMKRINLDQVPAIERQLPEAGAFRRYVAGVKASRPGLDGFLELTVGDSGPGIAASLSGDDSVYARSISVEREVLLRAFNPTVSRKVTPGKGGGLTTMLENLHRRDGAAQVRTGRLSLFRTSVTPTGDRVEWSLVDGPGRTPDPRLWTIAELAHTSGTAITMLVPIDR